MLENKTINVKNLFLDTPSKAEQRVKFNVDNVLTEEDWEHVLRVVDANYGFVTRDDISTFEPFLAGNMAIVAPERLNAWRRVMIINYLREKTIDLIKEKNFERSLRY